MWDYTIMATDSPSRERDSYARIYARAMARGDSDAAPYLEAFLYWEDVTTRSLFN